ncbi:hypothetical protein SPACI_042740 [Sporomusa acidovorans DSM 3132]|uniref:Uncharacterized protein n=2 Tax=Sporomusa TaxID=2375 RepID=A0ABZ3J7A6_SPOA4|nr:hypothetical protein SPACI_29200 [Sporomusa acidovorans DSM 3132]SDD80553.1 hypothetical protein SAMN04488499_100497 [Sporomusa acidovorans]
MNDHGRINELIIQLENLGYLRYQIQDMVQEVIGTAKLENLSLEEEKDVIEALEEHVSFANKCRKAKL